jgi:hypothetical protein
MCAMKSSPGLKGETRQHRVLLCRDAGIFVSPGYIATALTVSGAYILTCVGCSAFMGFYC